MIMAVREPMKIFVCGVLKRCAKRWIKADSQRAQSE
jgi:hypothetical protein